MALYKGFFDRFSGCGGDTRAIGRAVIHEHWKMVIISVLMILTWLGSALPIKAHNRIKIDINRPPGSRVDIGTHRLYIYCTGRGSPTVILDAGLGDSSLEWWPVQQRLAPHARVCAYDRSGYGWSDPGPGPRTSLRNAVELRMLLSRAHIEPPYLLVGHSFGGYDMQLFASLYPKSVAGLVLVDSSHPQQVQRFEAQPIGVSTAPTSGPGNQILMSQPVIPENLPAALSGPALALMSAPKALRATSDELINFRLSASEVANAGPWPDVPVVVLSRGRRVWPDDRKGRLMESLWMQLQIELAARSPHSLHILVRDAGHHIQLDRPEVVARAVELILDESREQVPHRTAPSPHEDKFTTLPAAQTYADDSLFSDRHTPLSAE
ncbi:MAG TPA: alpha/beta hydrolase [Gammaproteobacteria bacterium]|nr:alpha/beta hydrolase [Gammaproteobacteria bacterium]